MATSKVPALREQECAEEPKPADTQLLDLNDPEVLAQLRRDWALISASPHEREIMEWLGAVRYWPPDEPDMPDYGEGQDTDKT